MNKFGLRVGNLISEKDAVILFETMETLRSDAFIYKQMGTTGGRYAAPAGTTRMHCRVIAKNKKESANALHRALTALGVGPLPPLL